MKLSPSGSARTPDILFVSTENQDRVDERRINGAADLVVEIVDTESVSRDRGEKFYDYQANSVREYWIIDPRLHSARADFWVLDTSGRYLAAVPGDNGIYISTVLPNFSLKVDMFDQNELPGYVDALIDIIGMDAFLNALELT
jgi:Uma2 family endonuclease